MNKQVVLITGGATNLAKDIAKSLMEKDYRVIVHYNESKEAAKLLQKEIGCELIQYNFLEKKTELFFNETLEIYSSLDCIINCASIFKKIPSEDLNEADLDLFQTIHSTTPLILATKFYKYLKNEEKRGSIINLTDAYLANPSFNKIPYFLSKESLSYQSRLLAKEFAPILRVNEIAPGLILEKEGEEKYFKTMENRIPFGIGNSSSIVNSIFYLLESDYITGEKIKIDGGLFF